MTSDYLRRPVRSEEEVRAADKTVYVRVSGLTGTGKSVVYTEIATALAAIGLAVEHEDPGEASAEMRLNGHDQIEAYEPRIVMSERNISRGHGKETSWSTPIGAISATAGAASTDAIATDLLAALRSISRLLYETAGSDGGDVHEAFQIANTAITKAEGTTP